MKKEVLSPKKGFINSMNTEKIGLSALSLGAGRRRVDDQVDLAAGIRLHKKIGDPVEKGESLATLYYSPSTDPTEASQLYLGAVEIRSQKKKSPRLIQSVISTRPIK
jgi:pyrimidine-nucleoside phosphorylase